MIYKEQRYKGFLKKTFSVNNALLTMNLKVLKLYIYLCTEFLKRIKVSISHQTDTPDWKLISYISYIYTSSA